MLTTIKSFYIGFDIVNQQISNLLGYDVALAEKPTHEFEGDYGFYCLLYLNYEVSSTILFTNTLVIQGIGFRFCLEIEATDEIVYNLIQMAWNKQLVSLDGEIKALNLPESTVPSFEEYWCQPNIFEDDCRKELMHSLK